MESKKDIGNYFKENLEQLDYSPSNKVWDGIEVELNQKKKRRFFGFWLFLAVIAISGVLTYAYFSESNSDKPKTNSVVTTETVNSNENNSTSNNSNNVNSDNSTLTDSDSYNVDSGNSNSDSNTSNSRTPNANTFNKNGSNAVTNVNTKSGNNNLNKTNSGKIGNSDKTGTSGKVVNSNTTGTSNSKTKKTSIGKSNTNNAIGVASENNLKSDLTKKSNKSKNKKGSKSTTSEADSSSSLAGNKPQKQSKKGQKSNLPNKSGESETAGKSNETTKQNNPNLDSLKASESAATSTSEKGIDKKMSPEELRKEKKLSLDELKKANLKKRDSIVAAKKADKDKKALTDKPKDEEEKDSTPTNPKEKNQGIIIAPYYGLNYTGNLGNGNFLNESKTSKKTGEFSSSYGFLIRLMGSKNLGVQLGVGMINSVYSATFIKETNSFITQNDVKLNSTTSLQELNNMFPNGTKIISRQESTFMEVPVEAYYIFYDKKFGMATAFGVSFLNFQSNDLYLESDTVSRVKIGSLQNISPISWSLNVKLNLFYKITPKLNFDLYPSFQYQFMGYKDANDYQPYFFSIKTGLSYKL